MVDIIRRFRPKPKPRSSAPVTSTDTQQTEPADSVASNKSTSASRQQPISVGRVPCGADCWYKAFLRCPVPGVPKQSLASPSSPPASEGQRRAVASQLHTSIRSWQTRLIKLLPGTHQDRLECELVVADIIHSAGLGVVATGEVAHYEALSYSWGYPAFTDRVICNNIETPVTQTLGDALRHFRLPASPRYLWTDAFCINQFDTDEKSRQVRNMLVIYQKAKAVLAWIGMPEGSDAQTLLYVHHVSTSHDPIRNDDNRYHDQQCAELYQTRSEDLDALFSKPWFARTWIRQEVFASASLTLHCGSLEFDLFVIWGGLEKWRYCQPPDLVESSLRKRQIMNHDTIEAMRQSRIPVRRWLAATVKLDAPVRRVYHTGHWLEGLLSGFRFGATDSRDRFYGILGMLEERSRVLDSSAPNAESPQFASFGASVDYQRPASLVVQDVMKHLINRDRNLLPLCVFSERTLASNDVPTWTFNLADGKRRWYMASHLEGTEESLWYMADYLEGAEESRKNVGSLQDFFRLGEVAIAARVDPEEEGRLKITGYKVGSLSEGGKHRTWNPDKSSYTHIATSPPLTGFHQYLKNPNELIKECACRPFAIKWFRELVSIVNQPLRLSTALARFVLASGAASVGDTIVFAYGSPLPFVLRPHEVEPGKYYFLGPACCLRSDGDERDTSYGVSYTLTGELMERLRNDRDLEEFVLV